MPLFTSIGFDLTVTTVFTPLITGNSIVIYNCEYESDALLKIALNNKIKVAKMTPAHLNILNNVKDNCYSIKRFILGGEELLEETAENTINLYGEDIVIYNEYGPTEATVGCMIYAYKKDTVLDKKSVLIGVPIDNTKIYIMNNGKLCGKGMAGELFIGGIGLAKEYLNKPELTAEKFIEDPFNKGEIIYRTGDLVRFTVDNNIEYLGRIDEQVKIRGFRIELGEIKTAIRKMENVKDAVVIARENQNNEKLLFAYVVSNNELDLGFIKENIKKYLPEYMIPAYMMQIDEIPVTNNGKVDKKALPEIELTTTVEYVEPRNQMERAICEVYSEVLNIEKVSIKDNFFEIGGHSLNATKVVNRIEVKTKVKITLKEIFKNPIVEDLAKAVEIIGTTEYKEIPKAEEKEVYPMSSAQKRLFLVNEIDDTKIAYNMPMVIYLKDNIDLDKIERVIEKIVDRNEILRTSFHIENGEAVQRIHKKAEVEIEYIECKEKEVQSEVDKFIRPFDLGKAPLLRAEIINTEKTNILLLDMHHIISDGETINIFTNEFNSLYNGIELEEKRVQYKDYSEWLRNRDISAQKEYWINQFSDEIPVIDLPYDYKRSKVQKFNGDKRNIKVSSEMKEKIKSIAKATGTTEYMIFLSSLMVLLKKYSRQDDIIVGTPIAGRVHKDTENMFGMFVNTLAMRGKPEDKKTFDIFLKEMKDITLKAFDNQEYPFEELVEEVNVNRDMGRNPIFDVMFNYSNNEEESLDILSNRTNDINVGGTITKFDLTCNVISDTECYLVQFEYRTDLFRGQTIENMIKHYLIILDKVLSNLNVLIESIEVVTEEEKEIIINKFNNTYCEYPQDKTMIELFEETVDKFPDNIAIESENESITYDMLNKKANQLARKLRVLGIKNDDYVAMVTETSIETLIAICGIIKSGAAFVPIDPKYPKERINYIIADCKPRAIVTYKAKIDTELPVIDIEDNSIFTGENYNLDIINNKNSLIYAIYTSGTTGKPKGVMIEHNGVVNLREYFIRNHNITEKDIILQFASFSFDAVISELCMSIFVGAKLCMLPSTIKNNLGLFEKYIVEKKVTVAILPPQYLLQVDVSSLRAIISAGSESNKEIILRNSKGIVYSNDYGPTEGTVCATHWKYNAIKEIGDKIPIGKPIENKQVYILDGNNLCGIGIPGELCIAGVGLARGYINNEKLTDEKFIKNPYGSGKLYRSGDLARYLIDGNIEYLGRIDEQVKIRGFRIELGEVENVIREISCILDVAVIVKDNKHGDKVIYALLIVHITR